MHRLTFDYDFLRTCSFFDVVFAYYHLIQYRIYEYRLDMFLKLRGAPRRTRFVEEPFNLHLHLPKGFSPKTKPKAP